MTEVPDSIKTHNWTLYEQAMSADPAIACQYIGKLVTSLQITMCIADIDDYNALLDHEMLGARRAWYEYSADKNPGRAMQTVTEVLKKVGFLVYKKEFATAQARAFTGRQ